MFLVSSILLMHVLQLLVSVGNKHEEVVHQMRSTIMGQASYRLFGSASFLSEHLASNGTSMCFTMFDTPMTSGSVFKGAFYIILGIVLALLGRDA